MPDQPGCVLLSVGTELTEGKIPDTHLQFLGRELARVGVRLRVAVHAPDDRGLFLRELRRAADASDLVLLTGGLGPTSDDLTREVVAEVAGAELVYHPEVWTAMERRFAGRRLAEANRRQCFAPAGFPLIPNPHGTAPGFSGRLGAAELFAMPGPPRELEPMFRERVLPAILSLFSLSEPEELYGTAHLIGESLLEDALAKSALPGLSWGTRIGDDRVAFVLRGGSAAERERSYAALEKLVGETHIRRGDRGAAEILSDALRSRSARIATAESCTGGLASAWITDLPGSSAVYAGGVVAYSDAVKVSVLGVRPESIARHGAVSAEVVDEMAAGALRLTGAEYALAISGVAGPEGGTPDKPVGTVWVAAAGPNGALRAERFAFPGSREAVRRRSAQAACVLAETLVLGRPWKQYTA